MNRRVWIAFGVCALVIAGPTDAAGDSPQYKLDGPRFASATWVLPFDKTYEKLSEDDRVRLRSLYEAMGPGDEPPYPLTGMKALFDPMVQAQAKLGIEATFEAEATVSPEGLVTEVKVWNSPQRKVRDFIVGVIFLTKFKPAVCKGAPCSMGFPVRMTFKME